MKKSNPKRNRAAGFLLLEVLLAIVIFAIGVVGLIGVQAVSARNATAAKYRSDATLLVNQLLGKMWVSDRSTTALQTNFNTGGSAYNTWLASVSSALPGVAANPPTVAVDSSGIVSVAVYWVAPGEAQSGTPHGITTVAQIK